MAYFHKRIVKESQLLIYHPIVGFRAVQDDSNYRYFHIVLAGPDGSPFDGGKFKLELFLPEDYPMSAPKVRFITKIYHPNVDKLGRIFLDLLKEKWLPVFKIRTVLFSIKMLLRVPNMDQPTLNNEVADVWKNNEEEAKRNAREWTKMYAMGN